MVKLGPVAFFKLISPNALYGGEKGKNLLIDRPFQAHFDRLLDDISSGKFYKELDEIDIDELRNTVIKTWESEELNQVHLDIGTQIN